MAEAYEVTIGIEKLRQHFYEAEGREWPADDLLEWLVECGFRRRGGGWVCEGISLDVLDRSEYKIVGRL